MPGAVALLDFGEPLFGRYGLAVRAGGDVAVGQDAGQLLRRGFEFQGQDIGESAFFGFDDGAGVVGDQPAQHRTVVVGVAQVPSAVECVQACGGEAGRVADVVQPGGGFEQVGVSAEDGCQAACPGCDALDVCPATGEGLLEEFLGELSGRGS